MHPIHPCNLLIVISTVLVLSTISSALNNRTLPTEFRQSSSVNADPNSVPSYCSEQNILDRAPCHALKICLPHQIPRRCTPGGAAAIARKKQRDNARKLSEKVTNKLNGIMLTPGPRGNLGHTRRCEIAGDARIRELLEDQSDKLWGKSKPFVKASIDKLLTGQNSASWHFVLDAEKKCGQIPDIASREKFIRSIGGEQIQPLFQRECSISNHLEGVAEYGLTLVVGELFKTHAGEYVSLLVNKLLKGKWPNTIDYCSLACRKNKSGIDERRCVIGCAETLLPNCWSQCDLHSCKRGCYGAFYHRKKDRKNCYGRCESKCTLN